MLYAYGCNGGPTQAAQSLGLRKQAVLYMRRHYAGPRQLTDAASILVDAYMTTRLAARLGDPGIFMTDAMRFPTFHDSLTARHHFRYKGTQSILLYQHVTSSCICFFTKAILCNIHEAVHMLDGVLKQRSGFEPVINICDSAGKSDFVFGLAHLLNISIWPRISGRQNLKLWAASEDAVFKNIGTAVSGNIQWDLIERYWMDILWVLASIIEGKASPSLITERLTSQPNHPVTAAIGEFGKAVRSIYLLDYGMDLSLRSLVARYTSRRETWNRFGRDIYGFDGRVKEKSPAGQEELFWFLTVVQNAIVLWNALALEDAVKKAESEGVYITDDDLRHILPTMLEHINFVGQFNVDLQRKPWFKLAS
jgi:TnpA family transposase